MSGSGSATTASASIRAASRSAKSRGAPGWGSSGCGSALPCCAGHSKSTRRRSKVRKSSPNCRWRITMSVERKTIKVMLVEDHNLVRAGIRAVIDGQSDIQVIAEATEGREAIRTIRARQPDGLAPLGRFGDYLDVTLPVDHGTDPRADQVVVLDEHH